MPLDYVNYVSLQWVDANGIFRRLYPTDKSGNPFDVNEAVQGYGGFTTTGANDDLTRTAADSDGNFGSKSFDKFKAQTANDIGNLDADEIDDVSIFFVRFEEIVSVFFLSFSITLFISYLSSCHYQVVSLFS